MKLLLFLALAHASPMDACETVAQQVAEASVSPMSENVHYFWTVVYLDTYFKCVEWSE